MEIIDNFLDKSEFNTLKAKSKVATLNAVKRNPAEEGIAQLDRSAISRALLLQNPEGESQTKPREVRGYLEPLSESFARHANDLRLNWQSGCKTGFL